MSTIRLMTIGIAVSILVLAERLPAQPFELSWNTIDSGGLTFSTGGTFTLGGTIGQADAGSLSQPMTGGTFELVGGFWPVADYCDCPGDLNGDVSRNGRDVQQFVACVLGDSGCSCADLNGSGSTTPADIAGFVALLMSGENCP